MYVVCFGISIDIWHIWHIWHLAFGVWHLHMEGGTLHWTKKVFSQKIIWMDHVESHICRVHTVHTPWRDLIFFFQLGTGYSIPTVRPCYSNYSTYTGRSKKSKKLKFLFDITKYIYTCIYSKGPPI